MKKKRTNNVTSKPKSARQKRKESQERFIQAYLKEGTIFHACLAAGISRSCHRKWIKEDKDYSALFDEAYQAYTELMEREADRRAMEGLKVPVGFYQGQASEYVKQYSDILLIFRLKRRDPQYRDRYDVNHSGSLGVVEKKVDDDLESNVDWTK